MYLYHFKIPVLAHEFYIYIFKNLASPYGNKNQETTNKIKILFHKVFANSSGFWWKNLAND